MSGHSKWATIKHKKGAADKKRGQALRQADPPGRGGGPRGRRRPRHEPDAAHDVPEGPRRVGAARHHRAGHQAGHRRARGRHLRADHLRGLRPGRRRRARRGAHRQPQPHRLRGPQPLHQARRLDGRAGRGGVAVRAQGHRARRPGGRRGRADARWPSTPAPRTSPTTATPGGSTTPPTDLHAVRTALEEAGIAVESADLTMVAADLDPARRRRRRPSRCSRLIDALEDHDDVQDVYANFDIPDDVLEAATA